MVKKISPPSGYENPPRNCVSKTNHPDPQKAFECSANLNVD